MTSTIGRGGTLLKQTNWKNVWTLFLIFSKIGAFTFGGGLAMIPLIQREVVEKHHWITDDDILEIVAISESTPGPIAINAATFIGYRVAGFWGSCAATFGAVLPSFVIISLISLVLSAFEQNIYVQYAFRGIRAGVIAMVFKALWTMAQKTPKHWWAYGIAALAFVLSAVLDVHILLIIAACAVLGLVASLVQERRERK